MRATRATATRMNRVFFRTDSGVRVPAVSEREMREVDRIAVEKFGLGILQMMENAGRSLAQHVMERLSESAREVLILAGTGGNGGGGLCCARHLRNHGVKVGVVLTRAPGQLSGAAQRQWEILMHSGVEALPLNAAGRALESAAIVVDAILGYSLHGAPRGAAAELIMRCNEVARHVLALDLPSGLDATSGDAPGDSVRANETLTLALPKMGLQRFAGDLYAADIGIPTAVYQELDLDIPNFFGDEYRVKLSAEESLPDLD